MVWSDGEGNYMQDCWEINKWRVWKSNNYRQDKRSNEAFWYVSVFLCLPLIGRKYYLDSNWHIKWWEMRSFLYYLLDNWKYFLQKGNNFTRSTLDYGSHNEKLFSGSFTWRIWKLIYPHQLLENEDTFDPLNITVSQ